MGLWAFRLITMVAGIENIWWRHFILFECRKCKKLHMVPIKL